MFLDKNQSAKSVVREIRSKKFSANKINCQKSVVEYQLSKNQLSKQSDPKN